MKPNPRCPQWESSAFSSQFHRQKALVATDRRSLSMFLLFKSSWKLLFHLPGPFPASLWQVQAAGIGQIRVLGM